MCVSQENFRKCIFLATGPRFHQFLLIFELIRSKLLIFFLVLFGCRSMFVPPVEKRTRLTKIYPAQFF